MTAIVQSVRGDSWARRRRGAPLQRPTDFTRAGFNALKTLD